MFKVLTVVLFIFTSHMSLANDINLEAAFNTKRVVKMKLWNFGVTGNQSLEKSVGLTNSVILPEEITVALEKYDTRID